MRIILLFLVIIIIFWLIKRLFFKPSVENSQLSQGEVLVQCAHCQTHIPKSGAFIKNESYYCNQDHANKG